MSQQLYRIAVHLYSCENGNKKMAQLFFSPAENKNIPRAITVKKGIKRKFW